MGYDIGLIHKKTGKTLEFASPHFIRSNNVPAVMQDGRLVQIPQREAYCGITYNYSHYYHEAAEGDPRFLDKTGKNVGIRGIYGKTAEESIPMLTDLVQRIHTKYTDENGEWLTGERERIRYFSNGSKEEEINMMEYIRRPEGNPAVKIIETYTVSEGDTDDYWEKTAGNAILAARELLFMATQCVGMDGVWEGD